MKKLVILMLFAIASPALGQPQAPMAPQGPPVRDEVIAEPPKKERDQLWDASARKGRLFVVFVGVPARGLPGADTFEAESYGGNATPRIVVFRPPNVEGLVHATNASDAALLGRSGVSRPAAPFQVVNYRPGEEPLTADGDEEAVGRWPSRVPFPTEAVRYKPARFTQAIYVLNSTPTIEPIHRSRLKMEWQVPGGMEGVHGWRSDLYRYVPPGWARQWQSRLPVKNSFGHYQDENGHTRRYPDGTWFADLLSSGGKPFELRIREKNNGAWESYVAFRDKSARPAGYDGLKQTCASCHSQAGTGEYGVGLVPGADTVLSDPFEGLENGAYR